MEVKEREIGKLVLLLKQGQVMYGQRREELSHHPIREVPEIVSEGGNLLANTSAAAAPMNPKKGADVGHVSYDTVAIVLVDSLSLTTRLDCEGSKSSTFTDPGNVALVGMCDT